MRNEEQWKKIEEAKVMMKNLYSQIEEVRVEALKMEEQLKSFDTSNLSGVELLMYVGTVNSYNEHKMNIRELMEVYNELGDWLNDAIAYQTFMDNL